jgi:hypothetical protein
VANSGPIPQGTGVAIHVMRIRLEPAGTPFTAVEGYETLKPIEQRILDLPTVKSQLMSRRQGDAPLRCKDFMDLTWESNLNYQLVLAQDVYSVKSQGMPATTKELPFTFLGSSPMMMSAGGGGCSCDMSGRATAEEAVLPWLLVAAMILLGLGARRLCARPAKDEGQRMGKGERPK